MGVNRLPQNPIITAEMLPGNDGENINGPSLIAAPLWLQGPLGKFYLYFAHHAGRYIRLAYADSLNGPWHIYTKGVLHLKDAPTCLDHVASPDVHVDNEKQEIYMYFHSVAQRGGQKTFLANSQNGLQFTGASEPIADFYFKAIQWRNRWIGMSKGGVMYVSQTRASLFKKLPNPAFPMRHPRANAGGDVRHIALKIDGDNLTVYFTRIGDKPESILKACIDLTLSPEQWRAKGLESTLSPTMVWEGAHLPLTSSTFGVSLGRENAVRDPAVFSSGGRNYLLYSVAGESGIGIAEIT